MRTPTRRRRRRGPYAPCLVAGPARRDLGEVLALQERLRDARLAGALPDCLVLVEHPEPGASAGRFARALGEVPAGSVEVPRSGGDVPHGPGLLSGYLVIDLETRRHGLRAAAKRVQRALARSLGEYLLPCEDVAGTEGLWLGGRRVAWVGLGLRDRATGFGFTVNVAGPVTGEVTSLASELGGEAPDLEDVAGAVAQHLGTFLEMRTRLVDLAELAGDLGPAPEIPPREGPRRSR